MPASDRAGSKGGPRSRSSRKPADTFIIGTEEEVNNRTNTLYDWAPDTNAPNFKQIDPVASTGQSVNRGGLKHKSGDLKFGSIGKP